MNDNVLEGAFIYSAGMIRLFYCPLRQKHYCKSIQTSSDWSSASSDKTFLFWWAPSVGGWSRPCPQGTRADWTVWWVWKWFQSYAMVFTVLTQSRHDHDQNTFWGNIFFPRKISCLISPVQFQAFIKSTPRDMFWHALLSHFLAGRLFIL